MDEVYIVAKECKMKNETKVEATYNLFSSGL
jgi:hypothetical protein